MQRVSALLSWDRRKSQPPKPTPPRPRPLVLGPNTDGKFESSQFWPATLDQECDKAACILKSFCTEGYLAPVDESLDTTQDSETPPKSNTESEAEVDSDSTKEEESDDKSIKPKTVTKRIPRRIIQDAAGIAVFTCMRSGLWMTGSGGSGILIARKADGTWSPPSALILHTPTLSFIIGVDVYDCVLIISSHAALESLTQASTTLGDDVGLLNGPLSLLDSDDSETPTLAHENTVFTYLKSRGTAQAVNLNGCILSERTNENHKFYEREVTVEDVLAGKVDKYADNTGPLFEVIKQAEGRIDYDRSVIARIESQPAPGDALIESPKLATAPLDHPPVTPRLAFGIPHPEDPDPYGLKALEMAGMEIREAGTRGGRPPSSQFEGRSIKYQSRSSVEMFSPRSNRGSLMSTRTGTTFMTDIQSTQATTSEEPERKKSEVDYTKIDFSAIRHLSGTHTLDSIAITESIAATTESDRQSSTTISSQPSTPPCDMADDKGLELDDVNLDDLNDQSHSPAEPRSIKSSRAPSPVAPIMEEPELEEQEEAAATATIEEEAETVEVDEDKHEVSSESDEDSGSDDEFEDFDDEEVVVFEVSTVQPIHSPRVAQVVQGGTVVNIAKRVPPPLPLRSPARMSRASKSEVGDVSFLKSPLRQEFNNESQSLHSRAPSVVSVLSLRPNSPMASPRPSPRLVTIQPASIKTSSETSSQRSLDIDRIDEVSPMTPTSADMNTPTSAGQKYTISPDTTTPKATQSFGVARVAEDADDHSDAASFKSAATQSNGSVVV